MKYRMPHQFYFHAIEILASLWINLCLKNKNFSFGQRIQGNFEYLFVHQCLGKMNIDIHCFKSEMVGLITFIINVNNASSSNHQP